MEHDGGSGEVSVHNLVRSRHRLAVAMIILIMILQPTFVDGDYQTMAGVNQRLDRS